MIDKANIVTTIDIDIPHGRTFVLNSEMVLSDRSHRLYTFSLNPIEEWTTLVCDTVTLTIYFIVFITFWLTMLYRPLTDSEPDVSAIYVLSIAATSKRVHDLQFYPETNHNRFHVLLKPGSMKKMSIRHIRATYNTSISGSIFIVKFLS